VMLEGVHDLQVLEEILGMLGQRPLRFLHCNQRVSKKEGGLRKRETINLR
jgi:hypothetical protein